ncbi:MAG: sulfite exporter TauE/SafE family protein [Micavibrio aeruginosavorus]|uniref:Probable membrane transporter protein n=1 Tax=Micavibrio aeruginosavorus TaxID=349221 RepID=A0A7T5R4C5_9BACT|nr:MAG: sulfite exporter TauE/SafE family protein [Micavibrio aeruginosavorus]
MLLSVLFLMTAALYATVGFGGGSTYTALLALAETDYRILPVLSLICNIIVVSGGVYRFARAHHFDLRQALPWTVISVPMAWLGGYLHISEKLFIGVLGLSLLGAGFLVLMQKQGEPHNNGARRAARYNVLMPVAAGGGLGFVSGITGIGGGIFLAPVLYLLRWDSPRMISGTCSFFILVNSLAGLTGQFMKLESPQDIYESLLSFWMLFPAVLIGGQLGSYMGAMRLDQRYIRIMTALLMLYVAIRLLWRWWGMD